MFGRPLRAGFRAGMPQGRPARASSPSGHTPQGDVLIQIWGQSNAEGRALRADIDASPLDADPGLETYNAGTFGRVYIWTGSVFALLTPASNNQSSSTEFGAEFGLAVRWMRETTEGDLYIVKNAAGGLSITSFEPTAGSKYLAGQTEKGQFDAWLSSNAVSITQRAMLWWQGEANNTETQSWYQTRLEELYAAWIADDFIDATDLVILMQMPVGTTRYDADIAAAKTAVAALYAPYATAPSAPNHMAADNLHQNARGQVQAGYDAYAYFFDAATITV